MEGLFSLLLFAGLFFLMMRFGCGAHMAHGGHGHQHGGSGGNDEQGVAGSIFYTCPMHPEIRQSYPGNCPKCGMTLKQQ
jgi:Cu+-exporting ATPase